MDLDHWSSGVWTSGLKWHLAHSLYLEQKYRISVIFTASSPPNSTRVCFEMVALPFYLILWGKRRGEKDKMFLLCPLKSLLCIFGAFSPCQQSWWCSQSFVLGLSWQKWTHRVLPPWGFGHAVRGVVVALLFAPFPGSPTGWLSCFPWRAFVVGRGNSLWFCPHCTAMQPDHP